MLNTTEDLIKQADIQKIAQQGAEIYKKIKSQYEPNDNEKFLAIDIESEDTFLAETSSGAVEKARKAHQNKVFYVVKIGHSFAETLAHLGSEKL